MDSWRLVRSWLPPLEPAPLPRSTTPREVGGLAEAFPFALWRLSEHAGCCRHATAASPGVDLAVGEAG